MGDTRVEQIKRAHASAKPTSQNPAWLNSHGDLGYVLARYTEIEGELSARFTMREIVQALTEHYKDKSGDERHVPATITAVETMQALVKIIDRNRDDATVQNEPRDNAGSNTYRVLSETVVDRQVFPKRAE